MQKQDNAAAAAFGMDGLGNKVGTDFYKSESGGLHGRQQTEGEFMHNQQPGGQQQDLGQ